MNYPSLRRRFAAMFYVGLLVLAIAMIYTYVAISIKIAVTGADFNDHSQVEVSGPIYQFFLVLLIFIFHGYFWVKIGQTLGMQAWRLKVVNVNGENISWLQALKRFFMAGVSFFCGLAGYWWSLFDVEKRTWHDKFSKTKVILLPKKK